MQVREAKDEAWIRVGKQAVVGRPVGPRGDAPRLHRADWLFGLRGAADRCSRGILPRAAARERFPLLLPTRVRP